MNIPNVVEVTEGHIEKCPSMNLCSGCAIHSALMEFFPDESKEYVNISYQRIKIGGVDYSCSKGVNSWQQAGSIHEIAEPIKLEFNHNLEWVQIEGENYYCNEGA